MVSSTYSDLKEHRKRTEDAILEHGMRPTGMEHSGANVTGDVLQTSLRMVG
jgi:hypothetical protein